MLQMSISITIRTINNTQHLPLDFRCCKMENFYTTIQPLCVFGNILGFFSFSFEGETRKGHLVVKKLTVFQIALAIFTLCTVMIVNAIQYKTDLVERDFFEYRVWSWVLIFNLPTVLILIIIQMARHKRIKEFFVEMHACDQKISKLNILIDHARQKKVIIGLLSVSVFGTVAHYLHVLLRGRHTLDVSTVIQEFFYAYYLLYECFMLFQLTIYSFIIRERFKILQNYLK
jgi:hypothetical protein